MNGFPTGDPSFYQKGLYIYGNRYSYRKYSYRAISHERYFDFLGQPSAKGVPLYRDAIQNALLDTETRLQDALLKDSRQQSKFRQTEKHLQDKLLEKIEMQLRDTLLGTETRLQDKLLEKIEEIEHLLRQYRTSTLFNYQSPWWQDYSWLYRHVRGWQCEECQLSLNLDRQYLHTHHISGTQHNDPNDLKALCIACHSEQPGENHRKLKTADDYHTFMEKYGPQWCEARKSVESRVRD